MKFNRLSKKLWSMVNMPAMNEIMALAYIADHMREVFGDRVFHEPTPTFIGKPFALKLAYQFMEQHSRGKGTCKNPMLRRFYAAAFSLHWSKTTRDEVNVVQDAINKLTKTTKAALLELTPDPTKGGVITDAKFLKLFDLGFADENDEGQYLTDMGRSAVSKLAALERMAQSRREVVGKELQQRSDDVGALDVLDAVAEHFNISTRKWKRHERLAQGKFIIRTVALRCLAK